MIKKNIAIGKIGRASYFDKSRWQIHAGDESPYVVYSTLAKKYPDCTFYFIGANDIEKARKSAKTSGGLFGFMDGSDDNQTEALDIPENIIDLYRPAAKRAKEKGTFTHDELVNIMEERDIKIDMGIFMQGVDMTVSIGNKGILTLRPPHTPAKSLIMGEKYTAPINHNVNHFGYTWIRVNEDPRYVPARHRDVFNHEELTLSQITKDVKVGRIPHYGEGSEKLKDFTMKFRYAGIERMFLAGEKKVDFSDPDNIKVGDKTYQKKREFVMTLNGSDDRLKFIKEWVLKFRPEEKIYGKWDDKLIEGMEKNFELKGIVEMEDQMWETKFTYVPAFFNKLPNFVTQKVWKMIYYGIIPFWHKDSYDTDNYFSDMPDYFKVKNPEEMWKKIDYLNENPEDYKRCLNIYYKLLEDKYFNGNFIADTFRPYIEGTWKNEEI